MSSSFLAIAIHAAKQDVIAAIADYVGRRDGLFSSAERVEPYDRYTCKNTKILGFLEKKIAILYINIYEYDGWTILLDQFEDSWDYSQEFLSMVAMLSYKFKAETCYLNWDDELDLMHCAYFKNGEIEFQCKKRYDMNGLYEENITVRSLFEKLHEDNPHEWEVMRYEEYLSLEHDEQDKHYPRLCMALLPFDLYNFCLTGIAGISPQLFKFASN